MGGKKGENISFFFHEVVQNHIFFKIAPFPFHETHSGLIVISVQRIVRCI